jgi:hypothetical protein
VEDAAKSTHETRGRDVLVDVAARARRDGGENVRMARIEAPQDQAGFRLSREPGHGVDPSGRRKVQVDEGQVGLLTHDGCFELFEVRRL